MTSIVLPAYNESDTLPDTVASIHQSMTEIGEDFEIIVVENGSTDDTFDIATALSNVHPNVLAFHREEPDCGAAMRQGFRESSGEFVVNFDVDFYDVSFLVEAVALMRSETGERPEVVIGSKRAEGSNDERPIARRMATLVFVSILKVGLGLKASDTHGIKAFHRASVAPIEVDCKFTVDIFDTELVLRCERAGLRVAEIPVSVRESRPARSPIITRVPRTLMGLAKMRILFSKESIVRRNEHSRAKMHS